jgi:hypothetical protein
MSAPIGSQARTTAAAVGIVAPEDGPRSLGRRASDDERQRRDRESDLAVQASRVISIVKNSQSAQEVVGDRVSHA